VSHTHKHHHQQQGSDWQDVGQDPMSGDIGNAARLALLGGAGFAGVTAAAKKLTPKQQFQQDYLTQKNRPLEEARQNMPRWREMSQDEVAAQQLMQTGLSALPFIGDMFKPPSPGQRGYSTTVNGKSYIYDLVQEDPKKPTRTSDLMGPQSQQFFSRAFVTDREKKNPKDKSYQDVTVLNSDGTVSVQKENDNGRVELPTSGFGYSTYNRNDVNLPNGQPQKDQWGTPQTIANLINVANDYRTLLPNHTIEYGDIGTDDGKSPLLETGGTARHATHGNGTQVDIRYPDTNFDTNAYIRTGENWGANRFYYSPDLQGSAFFGDNSNATPESHHRDHLHMGFDP